MNAKFLIIAFSTTVVVVVVVVAEVHLNICAILRSGDEKEMQICLNQRSNAEGIEV